MEGGISGAEAAGTGMTVRLPRTFSLCGHRVFSSNATPQHSSPAALAGTGVEAQTSLAVARTAGWLVWASRTWLRDEGSGATDAPRFSSARSPGLFRALQFRDAERSAFLLLGLAISPRVTFRCFPTLQFLFKPAIVLVGK